MSDLLNTPLPRGFKKDKDGAYTPTDERDKVLMGNMQGLRVGGEFTFPSGAKLPAPPTDSTWFIEGEVIKALVKS